MFKSSEIENTDIPRWLCLWFRVLPLILFLFLLAVIFFQSPSRLEPLTVDWKENLTRAEGAARRTDTYAALALYDQVLREASLTQDWEPLLAIACGLKKLKRLRGIGLTAESALLRATAAAIEKRSRRGVRCAAKGLRRLGDPEVASLALSRVDESWPAEELNGAVACRLACPELIDED